MPDLRFDSEAHRFVFVKEKFITRLRRPHPDVLVFTKGTKCEVSKTEWTLQKRTEDSRNSLLAAFKKAGCRDPDVEKEIKTD